ncbi:hypothetical protein AFAEC_2041 [Aliarcobacter faecis]|uniref:hypothetical protein n=1 Tax=Aliarcobacter faecis TaxID=1564138 RepID=UPI000479637F|nr:hypothetical protein [Aliarcobacter faecis]QKF74192.1 hypothetical protein AFAEC_2041 [Aliarcobacter faecis]
MTPNELDEARTNPEFLKYLEEARVNSIKEKNIALMYETLDSMLVLDLDEEKINSLYEEILKLAFLSVEKLLSKKERLDLNEPNIFYIRALYEHSIEKWTNENISGAKELFFVIANIIDDEALKDAINCKLIFLNKDMSFDEFYDGFVDLEAVSNDEKYGYFLINFNFNTKDFLKDNQNILEEEYKSLQHLIMERK